MSKQNLFIKQGNNVSGPHSYEKIEDAVRTGKFKSTDSFSTTKDGPWKSVADLPEFQGDWSPEDHQTNDIALENANGGVNLYYLLAAFVSLSIAIIAGVNLLHDYETRVQAEMDSQLSDLARQSEPASTAISNRKPESNRVLEPEKKPQELKEPINGKFLTLEQAKKDAEATLERVKEEAKSIVEQAKEEAKSIVERSNQEAEKIRSLASTNPQQTTVKKAESETQRGLGSLSLGGVSLNTTLEDFLKLYPSANRQEDSDAKIGFEHYMIGYGLPGMSALGVQFVDGMVAEVKGIWMGEIVKSGFHQRIMDEIVDKYGEGESFRDPKAGLTYRWGNKVCIVYYIPKPFPSIQLINAKIMVKKNDRIGGQVR